MKHRYQLSAAQTAQLCAPDDQASKLRAMRTPKTRSSSAHAASPQRLPTLHAPPTITIASGKGGVGKSVLAVMLSAALAKQRSVTLIDADFGAANADVMLGIAPLRRLDESFMTDFAPGRRPIDLAIEAAPGLRLVPGMVGSARLPDAAARGRLVESLADFNTASDAILLDAGAGVHPSVTDMLAAADCPLIVTTADPTAVADAYALLKSFLLSSGTDNASRSMLVVNNAPDRRTAENVARKIASVSDRFLGFRPALAGVIPRDPSIAKAIRDQRVWRQGSRSGFVRKTAVLSSQLFAAAAGAHALRTAQRPV